MKIRDLPNFGAKSEEMLAKAGISSLEQIKELGALRTFLAVKKCNKNTSLNLLYVIEGVLSNRSWREVAKKDRLALLMQLEYLEGRQND